MGVRKIRSVSAKRSRIGSFPRHFFSFPKLSFTNKRSRWPLLIALLIILGAIPAAIFLNSRAKPVAATWWNASWQYRQRVDITNANASALTDFQISFNLDTETLITAGKLQSNCLDLRVTDNQGQEIPFWIEENNPGCNNAATKIWVKVPQVPTSGSTIYVYYGNATATAAVNNDGNKVFEFFDDFNGSALNAAKWQDWFTTASTNTYTQSAGVLQITTSGCNNGLRTKNLNQSDVRIRTRMIGQSDAGLLARVTDNDHLYLMRTDIGTAATDYYLRNSSWTSLGGIFTDFGDWSVFRIVEFRVVGTALSSTVDEQTMNSITNTTFTSGGIGLRKCGGNPSFDWIVVAKPASSEPTSTLATEETTPGPVVELKFDEGGGSQAKDSSGFKNHASVPSSTQWKSDDECISGKCLFFDSTDDRIIMSNNQTLNNTKQLGFSFWWKPMGYHTNYAYQILRKFSGTSDANLALYYFGDYNGTYPENKGRTMVYGTAGGAWKGISNPYTFSEAELGQWHHIAFSYDSVLGGQLYVDSKPVGGRTGSGELSVNTYDLILGSGSMAQYYDDFRFYPYAITQEQVLKDFNRGSAVMIGAQEQGALTNGQVGYWKMDETTGTTVADSSGFGNHGTLLGAQETGTAEAASTTTTVVDTASTALSTVNDAYNGQYLVITGGSCGISTNTFGTITDYDGTTKTLTVSPALSAQVDGCTYQIRHQNAGKFGNGLGFDSKDDRVQIGSSTQFDLSSGDFALASWIRQTGTQDLRKIFFKGNPFCDACEAGYFLGVHAGSPRFSVDLSSNTGDIKSVYNNSILVNDGQWHHILGQRKGDMLELWVDGLQVATLALPTGATINYGAASNLIISDASYAFDGSLDEARIFSRSFSADEIGNLYRYAPGPTAHYKLDEGSGTTTITDSSGNNNSGTMTGFAASSWVPGKFGKALTFSRSTSTRIDLGTLFTNVSTGFSGSVWIKRSGTAYNNDPLGNKIYTGNNGGWRVLGLDTNVFSFVASTGQVNFGTIGTDWTHLAWSYDPVTGVLTTYVNGKKANSGSVSFLPTTNNLFMGMGYGSTSQNFIGILDDVRLYNYARTSQQIVQDMNAGHPTGGSPVGSQTAYFPYDEGSGNTAHEKVSPVYDGTLMCGGTSCTNPTWKSDGRVNSAIYFSADTGMQGDYVRSAPINMGTTLGDKLTASMWIKPVATEDNYGWIIRNGHSTDENYSVKLTNYSAGKWRVGAEYYDTTFRNIAGAQNVVPQDTWSHLAVVFSNGEYIKIYLNGQFIEQVAWSGSPSVAANTNFYVGGHVGTINQFFGGYIDEVKIYNSELTADQIKLDYNLGVSSSYGGSSVDEASSLNDGAGSAPVAEYHFEEMTGAQAKDTSGNNHNGTITGAQWEPAGKEGAALRFDGSDYVDVGNVGDEATNFTVSAWINPSLMANQEISVITKRNATTAGWALGINANGTTPLVIWRTFNGGGQYSISGTRQLAINNWYYITVVHQDGTASLYVNGVFDRSASITNPATDTTALRIGYLNGGAVSYQGKIDEVKIYDYARTPAQIAYDYNRGGPVAHYKLDECQGSTTYDTSGGNNGTLIVGATGAQTSVGTCNSSGTAWGNGATGKFESSLNFDGTDDYIDTVASSTLLPGDTSFSLGGWFKTSTLYSTADNNIGGRIVSLYRSVDGAGFSSKVGLGFYGDNTDTLMVFSNGASGSTSLRKTNSGFNDNQWHHLFTTYDSTTNILKLFYDSVEVGSQNASTIYSSESEQMKIGTFGGTSTTGTFNGQIDDVRVYNYALSSTQVKQVMNEGMAIKFNN